MNMVAMCHYLDNIALDTYPVYTGMFVPNAFTLTLIHGRPRPDHTAILYLPAHNGQPAHWSFVYYRHPYDNNNHNYVYFGSVYLGPTFYWHAKSPSTEYFRMAAIGRACLCPSRCQHEGPLYFSPSFSFADEIPLMTSYFQHYIADVQFLRTTNYSHGPDDSLNMPDLDGVLHRVKYAFNAAPRYHLSDMPILVSTASMDLHLHHCPSVFPWKKYLLGITLLSIAVASYFHIPIKPPETLMEYAISKAYHLLPSRLPAPQLNSDHLVAYKPEFKPSWPTRITTLFSSFSYDKWAFSPPRYLKDIPYYLRPTLLPWCLRFLVTFLPNVATGGILSIFRRFYNRTLTPRPMQYYRSIIPRTMRIADTDFGHRLATRVALFDQWTRSDLYVVVRRLANEMHYAHNLDTYEIEEYVTRNITVAGHAPIPIIPLGSCVNCLRKRRLKQCMCYECWRLHKAIQVIYEPSFLPTSHVGMLPLYSVRPSVPEGDYQWRDSFTFASYAPAHGIKYTSDHLSPYEFYLAISRYYSPPTLRGRLCGPMFMGLVSSCFVRGDACAATAAIFRNCIKPAHHPHLIIQKRNPELIAYSFSHEYRVLWSLLNFLYPELLVPLVKWTFQQVLDHQKVPEKRRLHISTRALIDAGFQIPTEKMNRIDCFAKAEKKEIFELSDGALSYKKKMLPRCISAFNPQVSTLLSPYALPMLKHLNAVFHAEHNLFYASGSTPQQINQFLNNAIASNLYILEDDVSMADGSHSFGSLQFQTQIRESQFPDMPEDIDSIFRILSSGVMRTGCFRAAVQNIIFSGIPLTSWGNSVVFAFVRIFALSAAYKVLDYTDYFDPPADHPVMLDAAFDDRSIPLQGNFDFPPLLFELIHSLYMAIAGDDGKTFLPHQFNGVQTFSPGFLDRYIKVWSIFGFDVGASKIRTFDPSNWRLATFLAMRPVWSGEKYEYGPEIARRLTSMYWQLDCPYHPVAWARGISEAIIIAARHVPVLADIAHWYLRNTFGATIENDFIPSFTNVYSTFYNYAVEGDFNDRGLKEFLGDYNIPYLMYQDFLDLLNSTSDVLVNIQHPVLDLIYAKQ